MKAIKIRKYLLAAVCRKKINEFDRGSINIQVGVNVMATRAPAVFHYVQKSK